MKPDTQPDHSSTVTDSGQPVPLRIADAKAAHAQMTQLIKTDEKRARKRSKIKGMIDGDRPYKESELRAKGMSWRCNVNWGEAEGIIDQKSDAYTELVMELAELIDVDLCPTCTIPDPDGEYCQIIEEEYTRTMREWKNFMPNYSIMAGQLLRYSRGLYFWADPVNWQYQHVKTGNHLLPEESSVILDDQDMFMIRDSLSPVRAFQIIQTDGADSLGWNVGALKRLLVKMYKKPAQQNTDDKVANDYENLMHKISRGDLGFDDEAWKSTPICYILEKSVDARTVRMSIISATSEAPSEYLFDKKGCYENFNQAAAMFVYGYGEGDLHGIKGLGEKIFPHIEASNKLLNSAHDGQVMMNSLLMSGSGHVTEDVLKIARLGPITILPDSMNVIQHNFQPRIDGTLGLRNVMHQSLNNNTGANKTNSENGSVERVAAAVKYRASKEAGFEKNKTLLFYSQHDWYHQEVMRRMLNPDYPVNWPGYKEARLFKRRCEARGVPAQLLNAGRLLVTARRAIGNGSPIDKDNSTQQMVNLAPSMPEAGAYNALRDRAAFLVGSSNVNRYLPKDRKASPTNQHSIAALENNDMFEGTPVVVGHDQKHTVHNDSHLQRMIEMAEAYQADPDAADVITLAKYFTVAVEHTLQHNAVMEANPVLEDDAAVYADTIRAMAQIRDEVARDARALIKAQQEAMLQQQEQAAEEQDPEMRMKLERHALDMRLKLEAAQSSLQLKKEMQDSTIRMREIRDAHKMHMDRLGGK